MHRVVAGCNLERTLVTLLNLIGLDVYVICSPQLAVVLRIVFVQHLLLLSSVVSVINLSLSFIFALIRSTLLLILKILYVYIGAFYICGNVMRLKVVFVFQY